MSINSSNELLLDGVCNVVEAYGKEAVGARHRGGVYVLWWSIADGHHDRVVAQNMIDGSAKGEITPAKLLLKPTTKLRKSILHEMNK